MKLCIRILAWICATAQLLSLNGEWKVKNKDGSITLEGKVPGEIHTDLMRVGKLDNPYYRDNDIKYEWVGRDTWTYSRSFEVDWDLAGKNTWIHCDGIDTVAEILVNGESVATVDNQHRIYWLDVTSVVRQGSNEIIVAFANPAAWADANYDAYPYRIKDQTCWAPFKSTHRAFIRKAQNGFGWDWGPAFGTVGIYRDIAVVSTPSAVISFVTPQVLLRNDKNWEVKVAVYLQCVRNTIGKVTVALETGVSSSVELDCYRSGEQRVDVELIVDSTSVKRWFPVGYGDHPLYQLTTTYEGLTKDEKKVSIGFRTVDLVRESIGDDEESMYFRINDIDMFIRGSNFIPMDVFESRMTEKDIDILLSTAILGNQNMIRVWGGGLYQRDYLYTAADRLGLLIWQEFMFACSLYPRDHAFIETVKNEVRDVVRRLSPHPCIVLWSGNNENQHDGESSVQLQLDYVLLYDTTVQEELRRNDRSRPYWPASPSNGVLIDNPDTGLFIQRWGEEGDLRYGDIHRYDYYSVCTDISKYPKPKMASEFGYHALPSFSSLEQVTIEEDWDIQSEIMNKRNHHMDNNGQIISQVKNFFHEPSKKDRKSTFKSWIYLSQIMQGYCIATQAEHYRRMRTEAHTMGSLYWQLNDIWQAPTWASVEYGNWRWKMLHYMMKHAYEFVQISGFTMSDKIYFYSINDATTPFNNITFTTTLYKWDGEEIKTNQQKITIEALSSKRLFDEVSIDQYITPYAKNEVFVEYSIDLPNAQKRYLFPNQDYGAFTSINLKDPKIEIKAIRKVKENEYEVDITAEAVAVHVVLETAEEGFWSDNAFLLKPKDVYTATFYGYGPVEEEKFKKTLSIMSLFDTYN